MNEAQTVYRRSIDLPLGLALAAAYVVLLLLTTDIGFCRDEGYYFKAGQRYITWVNYFLHHAAKGKWREALSRQKIRHYWGYNAEHPPLAKLLMGASWYLLTQRVHKKTEWVYRGGKRGSLQKRVTTQRIAWTSQATAFRFPGMLWAGLMVLLVYLWGVRLYNRRVGFFAALTLMLMPRFFFHAHLAAFDVPISALWLLVCYAFWRSQKSAAWGLLCGLFFGLALATKHNAWILPVPLGIYWLCQQWNKFRYKPLPDGSYQLRLPPIPTALLSSLLLGPLIFLALWPLLWPHELSLNPVAWKETWRRLSWYVGFHMNHVHYDAYYFGTLHLKPPFPWAFPFLMTALTVPLTLVLLASGGVWFFLRHQRIGTHLLWWIVVLARALWYGLFRPLLGLLLTLALLVPGVLVFPLMLLIWLVGKILKLLPGRTGQSAQRILQWLGSVSRDLFRSVRLWSNLSDEEQTKQSRWYTRPRPVGPADKTELFWLLNIFIPLTIIALPSTPIFGGTKHWMPAWPFLALGAGLAFERISVAFRERWFSSSSPLRLHIVTAALAAFLLLPALIGLIRSHPYGLAYYNTAIGGPRGSANWKMQRQYWGFPMRQALPWMNKHLKGQRRGAQHQRQVWVHFHDTNWDCYNMYLRDQLIDPRIRARWSPFPPTRYIAFIHQKWLRTQLYHALAVLGARSPVYGVYVDDVPLMTLWEKPARPVKVRW